MVAMKKIRLTIELVPSTCWFSNVRSAISEGRWKILQGVFFKRANYLCEICGERGPHWPVELHERWLYVENELSNTQKLVGLQALCPGCHEVKHIGLATLNGKKDAAVERLMRINGWRMLHAEDYITNAMELWARRSKKVWQFDLAYLFRLVPRSEIDVTRPPNHIADFAEDVALKALT